MEERWLLLVGLIVTALAASAQATPSYGTCASIGYSTSCCPRGGECTASDGNCNCGADCYVYGDCCGDVYCTEHPRTCTDVGITSCCNDATNMGHCEVRDTDHYCSCDISCHLRNDCCEDIETIGCVPETCTQAGKDPGCCMWSLTSSCFVRGGRCYCDKYCTYWNDCCDDVTDELTNQCGAAQLARSGSRVQTKAHRMSRPSKMNRERFNEKELQTNSYRGPDREALATHGRRPRVNLREFEARVRHDTD